MDRLCLLVTAFREGIQFLCQFIQRCGGSFRLFPVQDRPGLYLCRSSPVLQIPVFKRGHRSFFPDLVRRVQIPRYGGQDILIRERAHALFRRRDKIIIVIPEKISCLKAAHQAGVHAQHGKLHIIAAQSRLDIRDAEPGRVRIVFIVHADAGGYPAAVIENNKTILAAALFRGLQKSTEYVFPGDGTVSGGQLFFIKGQGIFIDEIILDKLIFFQTKAA